MSRTTQVPPRPGVGFRLRGSHPLRPAFPGRSPSLRPSLHWRSYNPATCIATPAVWATARSLATTCAITVVFFSSGYLDVSVPRVRLTPCVIPCRARWVAPFGNPWLTAGICPWPRLIAACHVLLRLREPRHPSCALFSFPFRLDFFACLRSVAFLRRLGCKCFCVGIELYSVRLFDETDARSYVLILLICSCLQR